MKFVLLVEQLFDSSSVVARCVDGALSIGDKVDCAEGPDQRSEVLGWDVESIEVYKGKFLDELDYGRVARVHFSGEVPDYLESGWKLR